MEFNDTFRMMNDMSKIYVGLCDNYKAFMTVYYKTWVEPFWKYWINQ